MSDKTVIDIESAEQQEERSKEKKRNEEIINLIIRQTDYSREKVKEKLLEWNNDYIKVIKEYINPNFNVKKPKVYSSRNQGVMSEIRGFMDGVNKEYYRKKEAKERYEQLMMQNYLLQQKMKKEAEEAEATEAKNKKVESDKNDEKK